MKFTTLRAFILLLSACATVKAIAVGSIHEAHDLISRDVTDTRGDSEDFTNLSKDIVDKDLNPEDDELPEGSDIEKRGNTPDSTILERDLIPFEVSVRDVVEDSSSLEKRETGRAATDRLLFRTSMAAFLKAKRAKKPASLIWSDDGCSKSPDKPLGFNFLNSCQRHDFGYRNYKKQGRFTSDNRKKIDDNFKKDLYAVCAKYKGWKAILGVSCRKQADRYYAAVRAFGWI